MNICMYVCMYVNMHAFKHINLYDVYEHRNVVYIDVCIHTHI